MSITTNLQRLVTAKSDIADAITTMGGTVNEGDGFEEFPADILTIPTPPPPVYGYHVNYDYYHKCKYCGYVKVTKGTEFEK
jgi:hypothetical protein